MCNNVAGTSAFLGSNNDEDINFHPFRPCNRLIYFSNASSLDHCVTSCHKRCKFKDKDPEFSLPVAYPKSETCMRKYMLVPFLYMKYGYEFLFRYSTVRLCSELYYSVLASSTTYFSIHYNLTVNQYLYI